MKIGIKTGSQKESLKRLETTHPDFTEVWFNISDESAYHDIFAYIKKNHIETGLHYWGALTDGTLTNIAYPDTDISARSLSLMKRTVDIASVNGFSYVNIHPGSRVLVRTNADFSQYTVISEPSDSAASDATFLRNALDLSAYAKTRKVLLTVETVPSRILNRDNNKTLLFDNPIDIHELPITTLFEAAKNGIAVANDFGHTAANCIGKNRAETEHFLTEWTIRLEAYTKLLHVGYIIEPFNGTDYHGTLDDPQFINNQTVPGLDSMRTLLSRFINRTDVRALCEPYSEHEKNYFTLRKMTGSVI